jgi:hypothetical protein
VVVAAVVSGPPSTAFAAGSCIKANPYKSQWFKSDSWFVPRQYGIASATADFNSDGFIDVAVSANGGQAFVNVYFGSASGIDDGVTLEPHANGIGTGRFGASLAAGDFNKDGYPDLAVGSPEARLKGIVEVFAGSASGLNPAKSHVITREWGFGEALAAGDFDGNGYVDLAVGSGFGNVEVLKGSSLGLVAGWLLDEEDAGGAAEDDDSFGAKLSAGNVTGSGVTDLVVGNPTEALNSGTVSLTDAGAIYIFPGTSSSTRTGFPVYQSDVGGTNEVGDLFGSTLAVGNLDKLGQAEIVVGAPGEAPPASATKAGSVAIIGGGLTAATAKGYWIDESSTGDIVGSGDRFGTAIAAGDANGDGFLDLLVGAPGTSRGGLNNSGTAYLFRGHAPVSTSIQTLSPAGRVTQRDLLDEDQASDEFATSVAMGDVNKDGRADAVFGVPGERTSGPGPTGGRLSGAAVWTPQLLRAGGPYDIEPSAPITAVQTTPVAPAVAGPVQWAYTDNLGYLRHFTQTDPTNAALGTWANSSTNLATFNGRPAIGQQADGKAVVAVRSRLGAVWIRTENKDVSSGWGDWINFGGPAIASLAIEKVADGRLVIFATDVDGALWILPQATANGPFGAWLGTGLGGLAGDPVLAPIAGGIRIFARDSAGILRTALYANMAVTGCTAVGDTPIEGTPAVITYPGSRLQVFARSTDKTVVTIGQDATGAFNPTWSAVPSSDVVGSPAAVLDPASGKITVLARGEDGGIYGAIETRQGSLTWGDWAKRSGGKAAVTDVTLVPFAVDGKKSYMFAYRDEDHNVLVYTPVEAVSTQLAKPGAERSFTAEKLPKVPR